VQIMTMAFHSILLTHSNNRQLTQTLNLTFLYVTVSTLNPTVGIVVTDWPSFSLYKIATHELRIVIQMLVTKMNVMKEVILG